MITIDPLDLTAAAIASMDDVADFGVVMLGKPTNGADLRQLAGDLIPFDREWPELGDDTCGW